MSIENLRQTVELIAMALSEDGGYEYYHVNDTLKELAKDVADMQAERDKLKQELESVGTAAYLYGRTDLADENAKLRELCADMYGFIKRMDEDCGDVTFSDCFDYCKHDTADDGCCKTGECWYEQRLRELGVEVDG